MAKNVKVREEQTRYRDGSEQNMPGATIVPKAINQADSSGTRFQLEPVAHNIIEVDEDGRETITTLSAADLKHLIDTNRDGENHNRVIGYEDVIKKSTEAQTSVNAELDLNTSDIGMGVKQFMPNTGSDEMVQKSAAPTESPQDASAPTTEEAIPTSQLTAARARINPPPAEIIEEPEYPERPDTTPPVSVPEVVVQPPVTSPPAQLAPAVSTQVQERPAIVAPDVIVANQELQERPTDLDLEPDPGLGPTRLASYSVPLRSSPDEEPPEPLIKPAMMPVSFKEVPPPVVGDALAGMMDLPQPSIPQGTVGAQINLSSTPMQTARVRIRFRGAFGKLAVPYNVVFRYDIYLVMIQYNPDGTFYEPPTGRNGEVIEVQWHGKFFKCLPGPYFILPDQQTAFTVFFIDEKSSEESQDGDEQDRRG